MSKRNPHSPQIQILIERLARLSADSLWARRASGVRASLDKALQRPAETDPAHLERLIQHGFDLLEKAAQELPHRNSKYGAKLGFDTPDAPVE